ncbi:Mu transposase domain-containing protein [Kitasatospora sp. NBC_00070]|uniref:Mu transposase domain-containing protein n=1 Tax=Kitasatospora sp. NBC_00070 TaxID=2975962 RepID=UPI0038600E10
MLAELNERLARIDEAEDTRHIQGRPTSIGFDFETERPLLAPLPVDGYDCGLDLTPTVHRNGRVTVRQCYYSVPARFIGGTVRVSLRANELLVFDGRKVVARHPRLTRRYTYHDILDHYLEVLLVKPGAFAGAAALAQARSEGTFTSAHEALWAAAREAHGDREGTRALIEVRLLHRQLPADAVVAGIEAVLGARSCSPELVTIEARKAQEAPQAAPALPGVVPVEEEDPARAQALVRLGVVAPARLPHPGHARGAGADRTRRDHRR